MSQVIQVKTVSNLKFTVDIEKILSHVKTLKKELTKDLNEGVRNLAEITHNKVLDLSETELGSIKQLYRDNVDFSNPAKNIYVITLKKPALWIEEGRKSGFMEELLNGKSAKTGKNGKYAVIPFKHNNNPSTQSPKAYDLAQTIKYELQKKGVNWKKIEYNEDKSPRLGLLHKFNLETARPVDAQKDIHKNSLTKGIAVYQRKDSDGKVQRDVMTFRVISEKHKQEGLWMHPGRPGDKLMDKAFDWALKTWETDILPSILSKFDGKK
jgi:hypothetical protein